MNPQTEDTLTFRKSGAYTSPKLFRRENYGFSPFTYICLRYMPPKSHAACALWRPFLFLNNPCLRQSRRQGCLCLDTTTGFFYYEIVRWSASFDRGETPACSNRIDFRSGCGLLQVRTVKILSSLFRGFYLSFYCPWKSQLRDMPIFPAYLDSSL